MHRLLCFISGVLKLPLMLLDEVLVILSVESEEFLLLVVFEVLDIYCVLPS